MRSDETANTHAELQKFTTKHLYFPGRKKKFRVRYDKAVDFEPYSDGFGIMRDDQTAKPQAFKTGDMWVCLQTVADCCATKPPSAGPLDAIDRPNSQILSQAPGNRLFRPDSRAAQ